MSETDYEFIGQNPDTGRKYWKKKDKKKGKEGGMKEEEKGQTDQKLKKVGQYEGLPTSDEQEEARKKSQMKSFIEESLPEGDK